MIDDILTTTRMDLQNGGHPIAGLPLRRSHVAPRSIVERASERFRARYPERGLHLSVADSLPAIHVDATLFRRVLDNLLDNAYRYSPDGGDIVLAVHEADGAVVFDVVDRGIGISDRDLPRVFEPFFRAEHSRSRGTGGVGLGLTLATRSPLTGQEPQLTPQTTGGSPGAGAVPGTP
jgi:signal transduction histidine kinase